MNSNIRLIHEDYPDLIPVNTVLRYWIDTDSFEEILLDECGGDLPEPTPLSKIDDEYLILSDLTMFFLKIFYEQILPKETNQATNTKQSTEPTTTTTTHTLNPITELLREAPDVEVEINTDIKPSSTDYEFQYIDNIWFQRAFNQIYINDKTKEIIVGHYGVSKFGIGVGYHKASIIKGYIEVQDNNNHIIKIQVSKLYDPEYRKINDAHRAEYPI
jgi:hypothetical protein